VSFGEQPVGQSQTREVTVTASSDGDFGPQTQPLTVPLTVDRIVLRGDGVFTLAEDRCSGRTLQPGGTCTFSVIVLPPAGESAAVLEVSLTANCSSTSTWSWCKWHPDPNGGRRGEPYEREDLPDGRVLIRYIRGDDYLLSVVGV
jgi:hypothetical protein